MHMLDFQTTRTRFSTTHTQVLQGQDPLRGGKTRMPWHLDTAGSRKHYSPSKNQLLSFDLTSPAGWGQIFAGAYSAGHHLLRRRFDAVRVRGLAHPRLVVHAGLRIDFIVGHNCAPRASTAA